MPTLKRHFQRYLGQFKGRRANIWGRKDWQCPIASIQRGFNSWLAECSVNHCRNFLLFNHLCTFLGIGSSIWSGLPSVYCQVFLNAGSSLNQSLLYFPPSPAKYILFCCCLLHNTAHLYLPINPSHNSFQSKCKTLFKIVLSLQLHIITTCDGAGSNPGLFWPELLGFPQKDKCAGQNTQNTSSTLHLILNRQWGVDIKQTCLVLINTFLCHQNRTVRTFCPDYFGCGIHYDQSVINFWGLLFGILATYRHITNPSWSQFHWSWSSLAWWTCWGGRWALPGRLRSQPGARGRQEGGSRATPCQGSASALPGKLLRFPDSNLLRLEHGSKDTLSTWNTTYITRPLA